MNGGKPKAMIIFFTYNLQKPTLKLASVMLAGDVILIVSRKIFTKLSGHYVSKVSKVSENELV